MMTLQAREWTKGAHRLRHYPADSTRARARLAVLAIIAGGNTDIRTFDALEQHGEFRTLDLEREPTSDLTQKQLARGLLHLGEDRVELGPPLAARDPRPQDLRQDLLLP